MSKSVIDNISDTARWVAEYRARESARPDALFDDPLAARLAGERGRVIADEATRWFGNGWFFIARTKLIDDFVLRSLAEGCDRVVNLGAGLDTRPYRLDLPRELTWVEVDLPELIEHKEQELAGEAPRCQLTRMGVDLADGEARRAAIREATKGAASALVITEGILLYLSEPDVRALTSELRQPQIGCWIADILGPVIVNLSSKAALRGKLNNAPVIFGPTNGIKYFEDAGWQIDSMRTQLSAAGEWRRLSVRMRLLRPLFRADPRKPGRVPWSAVMRLRHSGSTASPAAQRDGGGVVAASS